MNTISGQQMDGLPSVTGDIAPTRVDGPCDRPMNYAVFYGARVARASLFGEPTGEFGSVESVVYNVRLKSNVSDFHVIYNIRYDDGKQDIWSPVRLFGKYWILFSRGCVWVALTD